MLLKNAIVQVDATAFRQWYEQHYGIAIGKKKKGEEEKAVTKKSKKVSKKIETRKSARILDQHLKEQFNGGRLLAAISSRPGQCGRADGYILEATGYMVIKIVILIIAALGLVGAMNDNPRYLQLFLLLLVGLLIWEVIYILIEFFSYKRSVNSLGWDIALAVLLAVGVVFTADITRVSWGSPDIIV
jgi:hypothetical protein